MLDLEYWRCACTVTIFPRAFISLIDSTTSTSNWRRYDGIALRQLPYHRIDWHRIASAHHAAAAGGPPGVAQLTSPAVKSSFPTIPDCPAMSASTTAPNSNNRNALPSDDNVTLLDDILIPHPKVRLRSKPASTLATPRIQASRPLLPPLRRCIRLRRRAVLLLSRRDPRARLPDAARVDVGSTEAVSRCAQMGGF